MNLKFASYMQIYKMSNKLSKQLNAEEDAANLLEAFEGIVNSLSVIKTQISTVQQKMKG